MCGKYEAVTPLKAYRKTLPTRKDMTHLVSESRNSSLDLGHVVNLFQQWQQQQPRLKIFCRSNTTEDQFPDKPTSLLCYQTEWQQSLLKTYGNQMTLLDAAHRSMGRALPLFFICVRTNLSYVIVGVFVVQQETAACIQEALRIFKEWNADWNPHCFLVDFCQEEISAVSALFKDTKILLCDSHRDRAWMKWVAKKANGVHRSRSVVLNMLRKVALAATMEEHRRALHTLTDCQMWKTCDAVRRWFSDEWMPEIERWAHVFRTAGMQIVIKADNGLGRQRQFLIYRCLAGYKDGALSDLITVLHSSVFRDTYMKHMQVNLRCSEFYRKYADDVPIFLRNRPREFISHVLRSLSSSRDGAHIICVGKEHGVFQVKSDCEEEEYEEVNLGADSPSCTCEDWRTSLLPCKHICCVIKFAEGWGWEKMDLSYWNNPLFVLDPELYSERPESKEGEAGHPLRGVRYISLPAEHADDPLQRTAKRAALIQSVVQKINQIIELIPLIEDETYLSNLCNTSNKLFEDAKRHVPKAPTLNKD
ncbi:uncharacterized protein LOC134936231 isoform X2 [Pseudophryne corroboree]|uniref:uncharacterized protein LOC134936231 isoform X2 n=1 Tax=Pseudophryne corroboree TaxID=495146 RepID=UPI0030821787